ncbi:MAG: hypothetical protein J5746_05450 [Victivallales bacterium]|nr:hypothetical protein [Victivallales bacterium]
MIRTRRLVWFAFVVLASLVFAEETKPAVFAPPFANAGAVEKEANAKPYLDAKNVCFVFGGKRVAFMGPGNFTIFAGEQKVAEQYMTFSSPYSKWFATNAVKLRMAKKYDGGTLCITERIIDEKNGVYTLKGLVPCHPKDAKPEEYKVFTWEQTAKIRPDGKLEIYFRNDADDAYMASRPYNNLNGFYFKLGEGITYKATQPRMNDKKLPLRWKYFNFSLSNASGKVCDVEVNTPSNLNENQKRQSFYFTIPKSKEERFIIDFLDYGGAEKHIEGGVNFKKADDLVLPESDSRNLIPNPYFAEGKKYIRDGGYQCFPRGYADMKLATDKVLFGRYALPAGSYRLASIPSDPGTYTLSFFLNGKGSLAISVETKVPYSSTLSKRQAYDTKGEWKRFEYTYAFKNVGYQLPSINFTGGVADGFQLEKGSKATEFDAPSISANFIAPSEGGNGFFESGKAQKLSFEISTLKDSYQGEIVFTVRNFYREVVLTQKKQVDFKKGEYPVIELKTPEKGFADGVYTIEMKSGKNLTFFRFSVMPYLKNTHATAKIFSPCYSGFWGTVDNCPEYYLRRLQQVGYGSLGHNPVFTDNVMKLFQKYNILVFDSGCVSRSPAAKYVKSYPELADKIVPGHVYFGVSQKGVPHSEKTKKKGLVADYRITGGWNEEYKAKFQEAVKQNLKKLPGRLAYGMGSEMPDEIKGDPHYIDLLVAYFEAVKSVYPNAHPYEGGAANMQIRDGVAEMDRTLTQLTKRWPVSLVACHPYCGKDPTEFHDQFAAWLAMLKKHNLEKAMITFPEFMHYYPYAAELWECRASSAEKNAIRSAMTYDLGWTERMSAALYARNYLTVLTQFQRMVCVTSAVYNTGNDFLDVDMSSRASAKAVNTIGVLLGNPRQYLGDCSFGSKVRCFVWETEDGTPLAAVWSDDNKFSSGFEPFPMVKIDYPDARFIDLMGTERTSAAKGTFQLTPFPYFIRGKQGDNVRFMEALKDAQIDGVPQLPCLLNGALASADCIDFTFRNDRAKAVEGDFIVNNASHKINVAPHGTQVVSVKLAEKLVPGKIQKINLDWIFKSEGKSFNGAFNETALAIPCFDGDWNKVPVMKMPCSTKSKAQEESGYPGDFDVSMQAAWTAEALCLRVDVTDDTLTAGDEPGCRWNYDICQIFMDTRCSARQSRLNTFDDDDYDYALMPAKDGTKCDVWRSLSPFIQYTLGTAAPKDRQLVTEFPAKFTRTAKGYVYEVAIPKAYVLPIKLTPGWNFAMGIYVADRDKAKSIKQSQFLGINPKGGCWNKPLNWPVCVLTE